MGNTVVRRCRLFPRFLFHQSDEATRPMSAKLLQKRFRRMHLCTTKISATFQALSGKRISKSKTVTSNNTENLA